MHGNRFDLSICSTVPVTRVFIDEALLLLLLLLLLLRSGVM